MHKRKSNNLPRQIVFSVSLVIIAGLLYVISASHPSARLNKLRRARPTPTLTISHQTRCTKNAECGFATCGCVAMNKQFINERNNSCFLMCEGLPRCVEGVCVLH